MQQNKIKNSTDNRPPNAILVDFNPGPEWQFLASLRAATGEVWDMRMCRNDQCHGSLLKKLRRCLEYVLYPLVVLLGRRKYRRVVGWQQFYGLNLAFWQRLLCMPKRFDLTVLTFIYKPKKGLPGWIYYHYMKFCVTSRYVDRIVCYAREECEAYSRAFGVDRSKFVFMHLGVAEDAQAAQFFEECQAAGFGRASDPRAPHSAYIFSAGRSNRDYPLLFDAMGRQPAGRRLRVACEEAFPQLPDGVEVLHNCYDEDMLRQLRGAYCVVIPLKDLHISAGQLAILQAMQYGKPIIATRSRGVQDYLVEGVNALMVDADAGQLSDAINRLYSDPVLYEQLSRNCRQMYYEHYTEWAMGLNFAALLP